MNKFSDEDIQDLKSVVRTGIVSSVNSENMTAKVHIQQQGITSDDLKIIQNTPTVEIELESGTCEGKFKAVVSPWKPTVGQWVVCLFKPDGDGDGFILGGI